jgi:PAS domain S-box-containing protein
MSETQNSSAEPAPSGLAMAAACAVPAPNPGTPSRHAARQRPRLLIVDDDVAAIRILRLTLGDIGEIHFARTGQQALQLAHEIRPSLVLLDGHMPEFDGYAVCAALKAEPAFAHLPIVFVTRYSDPQHEKRAFDLGAADFLAKPYSPVVLQARIRNLLELARRTEAELQAVREHWRRVGDARVADIVAGASDAIVSYDAGDLVVLANAAACRMFGAAAEALVGLPVHALLGPGFRSAARLPAEPVRVVVKRGDGGLLRAEVSVSRIGEAGELLTTLMLRDASDRERLEIESQARLQAEAASRAKTLRMSYIAHEMGNPLNGLLGFAQLMASDTVHPLVPQHARWLDHITTSGRRLLGLMRDVMDLGGFEAGRLAIELRPTDAGRSVEDALAAVAAQALQAGVTLSSVPPHPGLAPGLTCIADGERLHQCLANLLSNAIKYGRPGGWVRVEVKAAGGAVEIGVRDDGIGMTETQRKHLYEPYNRLGREHAGTPGAGLGLVVTRQLVLAMGGRLHVDSAAELGSCFTILLPLAPPQAATGPAQPEVAAS